MNFEHTKVFNFENAFRGMRNPLNSWKNSDSYFGLSTYIFFGHESEIADKWMEVYHPELSWPTGYSAKGSDYYSQYCDKLRANGIISTDDKKLAMSVAYIGPNDMKLAQNLIKAGPEHRKFLRQIFVSVDITAPLYIWKELDTYKISTTSNSTSTMHKLADTPITLDCFEIDDLFLVNKDEAKIPTLDNSKELIDMFRAVNNFLNKLENLRQKYLETKDERYWKELIRWLPESWLQTRTWTANYEVIRSICFQRRNHKLNEWNGNKDPNNANFISWARLLPYAQYLIFDDEDVPFQIVEN